MAAAIAAMAISCQKEETLAVDSNYEVLTLTAVDSQETKTSLSGSSVLWTDDDVVAVFDAKNDKNEFKVDKSVEFSATAPIFSGKVSKGTQDFYAVYPYERANSADGGILSVTIPADQTSKVGSFDEEHNISVAKGTRGLGDGTDCSVTFKNVCALLKFTLPAYITDAQKVTVSSNSTLAGDITVDYSGNDPQVIVPEDGVKSISMTGSFGGGSTFWFVLAPGEINGINVTVETAKTTYAFSTSAVYTIAAGNYKNLGTLKLSETVSITSVLAEHTYSNNILTGTDIVVKLKYDDKAALYMSDLKIEVYYEEEEDNEWWENLIGKDPTILQNNIREFASQTLVSSVTLAGTSSPSYPYIPSSDYKVRVSYKLGNETIVLDSEVSVGAPFNDGVHTVEATYDVYTSYTHYAKGTSAGIQKANSLDGTKIYADLKTINISSDLQSKYASLLQSKINGNLDITSGSAGLSELGPYEVTSINTVFDGASGITKENQGTYHVTGIPYTLNVDSNDSVSPWEYQDVYFGGSFEILGQKIQLANTTIGVSNAGGETYMIKSFYVPDDTNISIIYNGETKSGAYTSGIKKQTVIANESRITISDVKQVESKIVAETYSSWTASGRSASFNSTKDVVLKANNPTVKISNVKEQVDYGINLDKLRAVISTYTEVKSFKLNYAAN